MRKIILSICVLFIYGSTYALPVSAADPSAENALIENKIKDYQQEADKKLDDRFAVMEEKLEIRKENLEYRNDSLNQWLTILGVMITFFGIGIPIYGIIVSEKNRKRIGELKEEANRVVTQFIDDSKLRMELLEKDAAARIENMKRYEEKSKKIITGLYKEAAQPNLSELQKSILVHKAEEVRTDVNSNEYEKDLANALKIYLQPDYANAIVAFHEIINTYPKEINVENLVSIYYKMAYCYDELENYEEAVKYCKRALEFKPLYADAWNTLGIVYDKMDNNEESVASYNKAIEINPTDTYAWTNLGEIYLKLQNYAEAVRCYKKAISLTPDDAENWNYLGYSYTELDLDEDATNCFNKALELRPDYVEVWNNLGNMYAKKELNDKSIECYLEAIKIDKTHVTSHLNLIEALIIENRLSECENYLENIKDNLHDDLVNANFIIAVYATLNNNWSMSVQETFEKLQEIADNDPDNIEWEFDDLQNWLSSPRKSPHVTKEQREFINTLIGLIVEWQATDS
ncbi:MAG: hypothetical protein CFE23_11605 [Flavobacterium sp. BFFFF1]|uniref:tetratricopeptide repeat protein n=1 Tax=Flavobacterium sp. BFFFF1 TaxID=2015557 RepID=UPI000BD243E0|nr:tetratricopeptide repeat protein [Flavobacterium sp. BFFFF1]OYU79894.1 MAG: hypothetical protein CFE23_11605 [Flavobacterium sp. BFFFF1]